MPTKRANVLEALKMLTLMPAAGAGIGGLIGAARAEKGKRLRTAVGDAGVGALAGLGFGLGGTAGGAAGMALGSKTHPGVAEQNSAAMGGLGAGLGAVGAGMLGQKLRQEMEEEYDIGNNPLAMMTKINSDTTMKKKAGIEEALFKNPFVPRANPGTLPTNSAIPENLAPWMLTGGIGGGLIGALRAEKGKKLKGALRGGAVGLGAGTLGAFGARAAAGMGDTETAYHGMPHTEFSTPARAAVVASPYLAGGLSAGLGGVMMDKAITHGEETAKKHEEEQKKKKDKPMKKESAFSFGQKIAAGYDFSKLLPAAGGGAALGALGGGLAGFINPGEDGEGRRRSRFGSALRGALGGGALGGLTGAGIEAYRPGTAGEVQKYLAGFMPNKREKPVVASAPKPDPFPNLSDEQLMSMSYGDLTDYMRNNPFN